MLVNRGGAAVEGTQPMPLGGGTECLRFATFTQIDKQPKPPIKTHTLLGEPEVASRGCRQLQSQILAGDLGPWATLVVLQVLLPVRAGPIKLPLSLINLRDMPMRLRVCGM